MNADRFDAWVKSFAHRRAPFQPRTTRSVDGVAPLFWARTLDGRMVSAADLLTPQNPLLLIFLHPACGPCYELLPNIAGWQRVYGARLSIALVSTGTADLNRAMIADDGIAAESVLLQAEHELAARFGIELAPAALLIHPDGQRTGEPAFGAGPIRQLVADTLGLALRPAPDRPSAIMVAGESVPVIRRPTIDGAIVELGGRRETATLLLFVSPGCRHCEDLLPQIRHWETQAEGTRLLVISRGPVGLNRELALRSPMMLDDDRSLTEAFGVTGVPAAVLITPLGLIASDVMRGARAVHAIGAQLFDRDPSTAR